MTMVNEERITMNAKVTLLIDLCKRCKAQFTSKKISKVDKWIHADYCKYDCKNATKLVNCISYYNL